MCDHENSLVGSHLEGFGVCLEHFDLEEKGEHQMLIQGVEVK